MRMVIFTIGFLVMLPFFSAADTIFFKDGMRLDVNRVWRDGDLIKYEMYGTIVAKPKQEIVKIEKSRPADIPAEKPDKSLQGKIGDVEYRSDSVMGAEFVKLLAQEASGTKGNVIKWFFLYNDSSLLIYLTPTGDKLYSLSPNIFKGLIRRYVKNMKGMFGKAVSVKLKEDDGTTIGEGSVSFWDGHIKVELY